MYSLSLTSHILNKSTLILVTDSSLFCLDRAVLVSKAVLTRLRRCHGFLSTLFGRRWRCCIRGLKGQFLPFMMGRDSILHSKARLIGVKKRIGETLAVEHRHKERRRFRKVEKVRRKQHLIKRIGDCERAALLRLKVIALPLNPTPDNAHTPLLPWQHPPHNDERCQGL